MPKQSKKANKSRLALPKRSVRFWIIVVAMIAIGSVIVYARAATDYRAEFILKDNLAISYVKEKPVTVSKDAAGTRTYASRPRSIDVSKTGTLFCTPEDQGSVTQRQLSDSDRSNIASLIDKAKNEPLPSDVTGTDSKVLVNAYEGVFIRDLGVTENTKIYSPDLQSSLFKETVAYLEGLCTIQAQTVPDSSVPQWDVVVPEGKTSMEPKGPGVAAKLVKAVVPKAEATASSPAGVTYGADAQHENTQSVLYNEIRTQNRLPQTTRVVCLDIAAREWARSMAASNVLQHSNPIAYLPTKYCGESWLHIGENVGWQTIKPTNDTRESDVAAYVIIKAYFDSPGHKANMLNPVYNYHGIGSWKTADGNNIYTAHLFWKGPIKK